MVYSSIDPALLFHQHYATVFFFSWVKTNIDISIMEPNRIQSKGKSNLLYLLVYLYSQMTKPSYTLSRRCIISSTLFLLQLVHDHRAYLYHGAQLNQKTDYHPNPFQCFYSIAFINWQNSVKEITNKVYS